MSPEILKEYLKVLREFNAMSADIYNGADRISIVLGPEMPSFGSAPEPGGWKSPQNLDDPEKLFNVEEPSV